MGLERRTEGVSTELKEELTKQGARGDLRQREVTTTVATPD